MLSLEEILLKISKYNENCNCDLITKAYNLAKLQHRGQIRASGEDYFSHPVAVAEILIDLKMDDESICTALLHDVVEDTDISILDIDDMFGSTISGMIDGVTKIGKFKFSSKKAKQAENFRKFILAVAKDIRTLIVKLADRLHNMRTLQFIQSEEKRKRIANETIEIYVPLAERIGMQKIVEELQDLVFRHLHPHERSMILKRVKYLYVMEEDLISNIIDRLKKHFEEHKMQHVIITGRAKTPYSIWIKMHKRNVSFDQISDLIGFRIITNTIDECYRALCIIHTNFQALPYKFKDYISTPKPNRYQSLHTCVLGPFNQKIEIQIRTEEMHKIAETGIAAHWCYKISKINQKTQSYEYNEALRYRWMRGFLQIAEGSKSPDELLDNTKLEMFKNEIFCFTPQGDVIALPKNATPIDMAYSIHTFIGNTCAKAKINGTMMPLNTKLKTGDKVEIITSPTQIPDKKWYNFVVTGKAKSAIKKFIQMNEKSEFISLGYNIFSKMLQEKNVSINNSAFVNQLIAILSPNSDKDTFFEKIGNGTIQQKILKELIENSAKTLLQSQDDFKLDDNKAKKHSSSLIVGINNNKKVNFADCCSPIPGDEIVSVQEHGVGISIHRADCQKIQKIKASSPNKLVEVKWNMFFKDTFSAKLKIVTLNQPGSLAQIASIISSHGINITNIAIKENAIDFTILKVEILIYNNKSLENLCASLRSNIRIKSVERI